MGSPETNAKGTTRRIPAQGLRVMSIAVPASHIWLEGHKATAGGEPPAVSCADSVRLLGLLAAAHTRVKHVAQGIAEHIEAEHCQ